MEKDINPSHRYSNGEFFNPWSNEAKNLGKNFDKYETIKFFMSWRERKSITKEDRLLCKESEQPPEPPSIDSSDIQITWIGHATVLIQFWGLSILTDPIWYNCGPLGMGSRRLHKPPFQINRLPKIDAILISHSHYDHLDLPTIRELMQLTEGGETKLMVPLGLSAELDSNLKFNQIIELDWWESRKLRPNVKVHCTPAQHWSMRNPLYRNTSLWSSWAITDEKDRGIFFYAGDTGYCRTFKDIGDKFGPFAASAIPIGAYHPRNFLHLQHVDPEHAVKIHSDVKSKYSIGVHWGTFALGAEDPDDARQELKKQVERAELPKDDFIAPNIGKTITREMYKSSLLQEYPMLE